MRTVFFLLLSLALHATALSYPVLFSAPRGEVLLPVVILAPNEGSGGVAAANGGVKTNQERQAGRERREPVQQRVQTNDVTKAELQEEGQLESGAIAIAVASAGVAVASSQTHSGTERDVGPAGYAVLVGNTGNRTGTGKGIAEGIGYGNGNGMGSGGGGGVSLVGVSYAYTPKPEYPHRARREGREGTVVLRVLVDQEGKSKSLEVSRSSGFETLDKAAIDTVQRWRFNSARYGDKRVESWVKIPIVFRLADSKD